MGPVPGAYGALDDQKDNGVYRGGIKVGDTRDSWLGAKYPAIRTESRWIIR